jgi:hypothetical protein
MADVPAEVIACFEGLPTVGEWDQAFVLLTVNEAGGVDTCLLSRTELRSFEGRGADLIAVVASRRARANLADRPSATILVVADDALHTLTCRVDRREDKADCAAMLLTVVEHRCDSADVGLEPLRFRVDARLRVDERWDRTERLVQSMTATTSTP